MVKSITTDYLIIGAGAMGMAFADTLLSETDCHIAIVDGYDRPGGHWNTAYPFVRLHQPSAFYGVNSTHLGSDAIDQVGWNKGMSELASGEEVCAYFNHVMQERFLPSGRVSYFPMCRYDQDGTFHSVGSGEKFAVDVRKRTVDATFMRVTVPSMRPPAYGVADGLVCVPPNDLPRVCTRFDRYTIVGAGKTGMDACLWLLSMGVDPARLTWIMPRDAWLIDRAQRQPGEQFRAQVLAGIMNQRQAISDATSIDDLFARLEGCGELLRLSDTVWPSMYRCATVSQAELDQLRRIGDVVRLGRLLRIDRNELVLERGTVPTVADTVYIDCSADGLERRDPVPVFNGKNITLQSVRICQQVFSAAVIAHVEADYRDDAEKNALCVPVPHPDDSVDWLKVALLNFRNTIRWNDDAELLDWLSRSRLDWIGNLIPALPTEPDKRADVVRVRQASLDFLVTKLERLLVTCEQTAMESSSN